MFDHHVPQWLTPVSHFTSFVFVKEHGNEFPRLQSYYQVVLDLLDEMLRLIRPYITHGLEGKEFVPEYFLDAAGNLVDIISSDHGHTSAADVTERRSTIERAVQMIDRIMIVIFQVSASFLTRRRHVGCRGGNLRC